MILVNGNQTDVISVKDRGLQYGDGVFETIAVKNGDLLLWNLHWQRLQSGCARLNIEAPIEEMLLQEIDQLKTSSEKYVIKIIITRGAGGRGYRYSDMSANRVLMRSEWPEYQVDISSGISLFVCETTIARQPRLAGIKHLNRLENILARNEWYSEEYAEGLMLSDEGKVIEGTMSNVFFVKDEQLHTPNLSHCGVDGVVRKAILQHAGALGIKVQLGEFTLQDFLSADEIFMSNSLLGIWPVRKLKTHVLDAPGKLTSVIRQTLLQHEQIAE